LPEKKILLVTGRMAEEQVRDFENAADVLVADVDVAAFISPRMLLSACPRGYDLIIIPGAITADFWEVERLLNTQIRLGPKHAADLGTVLDSMKNHGLELSRSIPACQLILGKAREYALDQLTRMEARASAVLHVGSVKIGGDSRMKVLAEIVDATHYAPDALSRKIHYYEQQGADMIDLGLPLDGDPLQVKAALRVAKEATDLPVSIDTLLPELILAGIEGGADMLLSLNGSNLAEVGPEVAAAGLPAVVIPGPGAISLDENLKAAREAGIRVIADPVLDPPLQGLAESLQKYLTFGREHPEVPLFFGAGNVTELIDADTTGINALLAALAAETKSAILFTPEYSVKAIGSVHELAVSSRMMMLASKRGAPPKDLGLDLLFLKEKRRLPEDAIPKECITAKADHKFSPDTSGCFRIFLSHGRIVAQNKDAAVAGGNARDILNTLIDMGLVSRLDHAGYLGRELERAETALHLKRSYVQDEPLWQADKC